MPLLVAACASPLTDHGGVLSVERGKEYVPSTNIIEITDKGAGLRQRARDIPGELACSIGLPAAQGKQLKALCEQLLVALDG